MITVKKAIEELKPNPMGNGKLVRTSNLYNIIELLNHLSLENEQLKVENDILKATLSEIKKHQTACNALKFAIARGKELEAGIKAWKDRG